MMDAWLAALEARHLADMTFSEVARALRALSSTYVERRERLGRRGAFDSAGKRAAYALYYSPLHFLTVDRIVAALGAAVPPPAHILDLGCGAGAAGAAWATRSAAATPGRRPPAVTGMDVHPWALGEAAFTYRRFHLHGDTRRGDAGRLQLPRGIDAVVVGWAVNELDAETRAHVFTGLLEAAARRTRILVVEPIAKRVSPWWGEWARACEGAGGRADEWRFEVELPDLVKRLDHAAGMRHDELTARSLWLGPGAAAR